MPEILQHLVNHYPSDPSRRYAIHNPLGPSFFQLTLSSANKAEIFAEALSELDKNQSQTSTIVKNLQKWSPEAASRFGLRSTSTVLSTPFRLIYPNCDLHSFEETGLYVRQFLAISYCWHSPEFLSEGYKQHDIWPVKKSIVDAVLAEKDHPRVGIWMDQICIEQSSALDKQLSIAAMDIIYRSCMRMVVLFEDVLLTQQEIQLVQKYDISQRPYNDGWKFESREIETFASFYEKVNAARWWSRAWCFHEMGVHRPWSERRQTDHRFNATFILCGPNDTTLKMKWTNLILLMSLAMHVLPNAQIWWKGQATVSGMIKPEDQGNGWSGSIMARHNAISTTGCSVLQDRISILVNLCGLGLAYKGPPLDTEEELLYLISLLALAAGDLYPLSMMDRQSTMLKEKPTWISKHEVNDTTIPGYKIGTMEGIHRVEEEEIELDMLFLDAPWRSIKEKDLRPTYDIFPYTITTTYPARKRPEVEGRVASNHAHSDAEYDIPRRRFLAGCILNGDMFAGRLWEQIKRDVVGPNYNAGYNEDLSPNPAFRSAAKVFLAHLVPVSTLLGIVHPSPSTLDDATLFLTWLTDYRSMYYIGYRIFRVPCTMLWDSAFITSLTVNEHFHDGPDREIQVAVPTHLLKKSCMPLRVWILRPVKDDQVKEKWRIVAKALLLGEPDLLTEAAQSAGKPGAKVILRERTVVSG
ncbi:HET domain containing protein [Pyrenophora teres f. maculata]|nr:HET domain containing protein [Pyrenophora teres f. maculata]